MRRAGSRWPARWSGARPTRITTAWWKEERGERVFIDFNQTARDRTFASAYSVRRTPSDRVDTGDVGRASDADPHDFTLATVPIWSPSRGTISGSTTSERRIEPLLEWSGLTKRPGIGDVPYPPNYPKMPGEPKRVQPSRDTDLKRENKRK